MNAGSLAMALLLAAGALLPVQAAVNARLGRGMGHPLMGALGSFLVGTTALLAYCIIARLTVPSAASLGRIPGWAWIGGLLGAVFVGSVTWGFPKVGAATGVALTVTGQILASLTLDHFGLLGLTRHPISFGRVAGALLLIVGILLIRRF